MMKEEGPKRYKSGTVGLIMTTAILYHLHSTFFHLVVSSPYNTMCLLYFALFFF